MGKRKIPVVGNSLTPEERAFIEGGIADHVSGQNPPQTEEETIALNMVVPKRIKHEMKAYKEYGGFKRIGDLQEKVWDFFKENHQSLFQDIQKSWNLEN
ncbi:hypothetical protein HYR99_20190 [Candidatus Poribacteria bacterium]|nr:hypothetical protein [Candidatus Poribacteria bacterium]